MIRAAVLVGLIARAAAPATLLAAGSVPAEGLHARYRADAGRTIDDNGVVRAWAGVPSDGAPARPLDRHVGQPLAIPVTTPRGAETITRFDGNSALWASSGDWGRLDGERTVSAYVRVARLADGFLFDGSTQAGMTRARVRANRWEAGATPGPIGNAGAAGAATHPLTPGVWQAHVWRFSPDGDGLRVIHRIADGVAVTGRVERAAPLAGFILGADVTTVRGLACDVAEVIVHARALTAAEEDGVLEHLGTRWGSPARIGGEPPDPSADPRLFTRVLRAAGDEGVHTYRIPGLAVSAKGTLIAVFDLRHRGGGDLPGDIDVGVLRSTDRGETWGPVARALDFDAAVPGSRGNGVGDPAVLADPVTGRIIIAALSSRGNRAWNGSGPGLTPEETGQFMLTRSDDDGLTWSAPVSITPQVKDPAWRLCFNGPGNGIVLSDGSYVFPAQYRDARGVSRSCAVRSRDRGDTWTILPAAWPDGPPTSEAAVAEAPDGALVISMRDEGRSGKRAWARWEWDAARASGTWTRAWHDLPDPTCMASLVRHPSGELLFSNPASAAGRRNLTLRRSRDGGATWSAGSVLEPGGAMYSSLAVLPNGDVAILHESGPARGLVFSRFPLDWIK